MACVSCSALAGFTCTLHLDPLYPSSRELAAEDLGMSFAGPRHHHPQQHQHGLSAQLRAQLSLMRSASVDPLMKDAVASSSLHKRGR